MSVMNLKVKCNKKKHMQLTGTSRHINAMGQQAKPLSRLQKQLINDTGCIAGCKEYVFHWIYKLHLGKILYAMCTS